MKSLLFVFIFCYFFSSKNVTGHLKDMGKIVTTSPPFVRSKYAIVGGVPASSNWFPFNVQLFNFGGMCGGSIITKKTVLTAAHCFDLNTNVKEMKVFSNSRHVFDMKSFIHDVWRFKTHEEYNKKMSFSNDIAVVMIVDEFVFTKFVQTVPLCNSEVWMKENETFYVSGWGETKYGEGILNQVLRMTYLNLIPNDRCEAAVEVKLSLDMFCLYGGGLRDTCRGDSGGGVVWHNMLVGIISHGEGCVKKPGIYINVSRMRPWIKKVVNNLNDKYCFENRTGNRNIT